MRRNEPVAYRDLTVLIVDDFSTMRRIIKNILNDLDFENILEAEDGTTAVNILNTEKVDFIVCDWNMPRMTGLELLQYVRANEELKDLPFLMVTAESEKKSIVDAVKAKVSQYIIKPFTAATLAEKIAKILPPE
jgi:two-component system chemotaxis response regulator CheY